MAYFVARVELHEIGTKKPTYSDYERLHVSMQQKKYFRLKQGGDGVWYHMPDATYSAIFTGKTASTILDEVTVIVDSVWGKAGKLVIEGSSTWIGLVPASAQDVQRLTS
jgi:hypothetical protein